MSKKENEQKRELLNVEFEDDYKVQNEIEEESLDSETVKRRLLNLPQQSSPSLNNKSSSNNDSTMPSRFKTDESKKDKAEKANSTKNDEAHNDRSNRRKQRDEDYKNRSEDPFKKTQDEKDVGNKPREELANPLKEQTQKIGKDKIKDTTKQGIKQGTKEGIKKGGEKGVKKATAKAAKIAAQAAKKLIVKGTALASKALLAVAGYIGLPAILVGLSIVILVIILMTLSTMMFGTGQGVEEAGPEATELHAYIVELSNNSVDASKPEQMGYRVPEALLAAVIQLESMLSEDGNTGSIDDIKELLAEIAEELKPTFTYSTFTEWTETSTRVCAKAVETKAPDGTIVMQCTAFKWSEPSRSSTEVKKITAVEAWNGSATYKYEAEQTEWVENGDTRTRSKSYIMSEQKVDYSFAKLDKILNERGYLLEDKRMFEFFFESATNQEMHYLTWLETGSVPEGFGGFGSTGYYGFDGNIIPGSGVPQQYMAIYRAAEAKYGVPWHTLAAIHSVETNFSTHPSMVSTVGAIGHMQFMPRTWIGWSYPRGSQTANGNISGIPPGDLTNPNIIKQYGGLGVDANGDGKADPWDIEDAIHSAANLLSRNGYASSPYSAIFSYNRADWYVEKVMNLSKKFEEEATYQPTLGGGAGIAGGVEFDKDFNGPQTVKIMLNEAYKYMDYPYKWGGANPRTSFDCSGIVQWSYAKAGIKLPRVSRDQYKATQPISASEAKPGDLVFFAKPGSGWIYHVGIYIGNGKMYNAQSNGLKIVNIKGWNGGKDLYGYTRVPGVNY